MPHPTISTVIQVFDKPFMLTSEYIDPKNLPYESFLFGQFILSGNDIVQKNWFINYDVQSGRFSRLAVRNTLTYTRLPPPSNRLIKIEELTEWFHEDGTAGTSRDQVTIFR